MDTPMQEQWAKKSRFLMQALIFSGALNIGLITSLFYLIVQEREGSVAFELQPTAVNQEKISNNSVLASFATMSYPELIDLLDNDELVEEGYRKRDLALASLAMFHCVNVEKAVGGFPLQKRGITFHRSEGPEQVQLTLFPGLTEDQFGAIRHFLKTEKFPFTTEGLFFELKQSKLPRDPSLLEAFYLTPEFSTVMTLFARAGLPLPQHYIVELVTQGSWSLLDQFSKEQRQTQDLSPDRLKMLLTAYVKLRSLMAAKILLGWDRSWVLKKFDDPDLVALLDLFPEKSASIDHFLRETIISTRSDAIRQKAAEKLYGFANLPVPDPYDHRMALETFIGALPPKKVVQPAKKERQVHVVQTGDNLWKIGKKYKVSIDAIRKLNRLETDKLKVGKELLIPVTDGQPRPDAKDGSGKGAVSSSKSL